MGDGAHEQQLSNSPVVGEKRLREEDDNGEQERHDNANSNQDKTESEIPTAHATPGSNGQMTVGAHLTNGSVGHGFDALYIGDLQWVRLFICLVLSCLSCSETLFHVFSFSCLFNSGQLMRISGKSRSMSVLH